MLKWYHWKKWSLGSGAFRAFFIHKYKWLGSSGRRSAFVKRYARGKKDAGFYGFFHGVPPSIGGDGGCGKGGEIMANGSYVNGGAYLNVDMSDVQKKIDFLRGFLKKDEFERLMYRTFNEVGKKSKTLISKQIPRDYAVKKAWAASQIGHFQLEMGGLNGVTCKIPLKGHKGSIGGRFSAAGGRLGLPLASWITRDGMSYLPTAMKNQGGNPPFIATGRGNGVAFTRRTKKRLPIVRVVGLGVPQMPLNRSADEVQDQLLDYVGNRLEHNFYNMFIQGNK